MLSALALDLLGGVTAPILGVAVLWSAYLLAALLVSGDAPVSARWSATLITGCWLLVAAFWLLVPFGAFRLSAALLFFLALATLLHRALARRLRASERLRGDTRRAREVLGSLAGTPAGWSLGALALVAGVRLLRGTASPCLGWDALTYHLYKAGRWVQLGTLAPQPAPDAWSYYEYFPVVGDVFWAWAMLPLRSDALITAAGGLIWLGLLLGVYAAARELGATPRRAALAGAAVCAMPSVLSYLSSGYVDNTVAALFALGSVFVLRVHRHGTVLEAPLALGAMSLMVGTKLTSAAFFAVAALLVAYGVWRSKTSTEARRVALLLALAAATIGFPSYQRAWIEQGSPFYPFAIAFGDVVLSEGAPAVQGLNDEVQDREGFRLSGPTDFWRYFLFLPKLSGAFLNPGAGALVIVLLGVGGLIVSIRDRDRRLGAVFLALCGLLMLLGFLSSNMEVFRTTFKVTTAGRYVTVGLVAMAVLGAAWRSASATALWTVAVIAGLALSFPRVWVGAEAPALAGIAGVLVAFMCGSALLCRGWRSSGRPYWRAVLSIVLLASGLVAVERVRDANRYRLYAAAVDSVDPLFHMHALHPVYASAWPIWRELDGAEPHRLAVTAGWDGLGHNWYRFPLLGSRLQNHVLYVPVTADGRVVDYRDRTEVADRASFLAWLRRLVEQRVDHVVSLAPRATIEDLWMRKAPEVFEPAVVPPGGFHAAFRFRRDAATAYLQSSRSRPSRDRSK